MLAQMSERMGAEHYGEESAETTMTVRWVAERLAMSQQRSGIHGKWPV